MKGKSVASIVLSAALVSSIAVSSLAFGAETEAPASGSESLSAPVEGENRTLTIKGSERTYPGQEEAWNKLVSDFEAENPNVTVNLEWQADWDDIPSSMTADKIAGETVDLYTAGAGIINSSLAQSGLLLDMTDIMKKYDDRFNEGMLDAYFIGGKQWGFPYGDASESCVYYNKTMFDELGLTPPKTFDELVTIADTIRDKKGITPMIHCGKDVGFWPMWWMETYAQASGNKSVDNVKAWLSGEKSFKDDPEVIKAFDYLKEFIDKNVLDISCLDTDRDGVYAMFAADQAAMYYCGTWEYPNIRTAVDESVEIGCFEFPSMEGVQSQHGGGPSDAIVIPSWVDRNQLDVIERFIDFMTREDQVNTVISTFVPIVSVIKGVVPADNELTETLNGSLRDNTIMFLDWIWPSTVNDAMCNAIPGVLAGQMTSEEAAASLQDALDNVVEEQGYSYNWYDSWSDDDWAAVEP